jgi:hypothetical protein
MGIHKKDKNKIKILVYPEWELQPKESPSNFRKFAIYRDMKINRSHIAVARAIGTPSEQLKKEANRINNIATDWEWSERCKLYEKYLDKIALESNIRERKEMNKRLAKDAQAIETVIMTAVSKYLEKYRLNQINFDELSDKDFFYMITKGAEKLVGLGEFQRKLAGEPTEKIQAEISTNNINTNLNFDNLTHEELLEKAKELGFVKANKI